MAGELGQDAQQLMNVGKAPFPMLETLVVLAALVDSDSLQNVSRITGWESDRVSRMLTNFKERFGGQELVEKRGPRVVPSAKLKRLAPELHQFLDAYNELAIALSASVAGRGGSIRLGTYNPALKLFLARAIGAFGADGPEDVRLQLPADMNDRRVAGSDLVTELLEERLDLLVIPVGASEEGAILHPDLEVETLYEWHIVVVAPDLGSLVSDERVRPKDLENAPLLLAPKGFSSRTAIDAAFRSARVERRCIHDNPDTETRVRLALNGYGVALAPNDTLPESDGLPGSWPSFLGHGDIPVSGRYVLITRKGPSERPDPTPAEGRQILIDHIREAAADLRQRRGLAAG